MGWGEFATIVAQALVVLILVGLVVLIAVAARKTLREQETERAAEPTRREVWERQQAADWGTGAWPTGYEREQGRGPGGGG